MDVIVLIVVVCGVAFFYFKDKYKPTKTHRAPPETERIKFSFMIYDDKKEIEPDTWFQMDSAKNKSFINYRATWDGDWKMAGGGISVAGISHDVRRETFLRLGQAYDFMLFLENEPGNPANENAIKVMASATISGELIKGQIGYLPDSIANEFAGVELDIKPESAFLPPDGSLNLGLKIKLLSRSARYLKRQNKKELK